MGMKTIPKGYASAIRSKIGIEKEQIKYIAKNIPLTYMQVVSRINDMLHFILDELKFYMEIWINSKVPKRTGQLRYKLIKSMEQSKVKYGMLKFILGTRIDYAAEVNKMRAATVRHFGELGYGDYGMFAYKGKRPLIDPEAAGYYFDELLKYINEQSRTILTKAIAQYFSGSGGINPYVRKMI